MFEPKPGLFPEQQRRQQTQLRLVQKVGEGGDRAARRSSICRTSRGSDQQSFPERKVQSRLT